MHQVTPGSLLVATRALLDPHFTTTVVLMLDVNDEGALGVVLNRPSPVPVGDVLDRWSGRVAAPDVLFEGGPVGLDGAIAVAVLRDVASAPVGFRPIVDRLGVVDLDTPVELVDGTLAGMRVFAGYAGWGADQLRGEIERGDWYVVPYDEADPFRADPACLWRDVLLRQPGQLAWHANRPVDPDLN